MSYLLDTDILSNLVKKSPSFALLRRLAVVAPEDQFTTTITIGEMVYGAYKSPRTDAILQSLQADVWPRVHVLPFDFDAAFIYGRLRRDLELHGTPLPEPDLRIASVALARGLTLITGNVKHFSRIAGLTVENWLV